MDTVEDSFSFLGVSQLVMDDETKELVRIRSGRSCEYCGIHQRYSPAWTFHVEHIVATQHDGSDEPDNLALACHLCNRKKGPNLSGVDPQTRKLSRLFNPRTDIWKDHFRLEPSGEIVGVTEIGRTTVHVLGMNAGTRVDLRREIRRVAAQGEE